MAPTFVHGKLAVAVYPFRLRPGHVVIFRHHSREKIKRITHIEKKRVFVVGDNDAASTDSREFGWISRDQILGKVICRL